jgi:SAM-dependent methyltransferase
MNTEMLTLAQKHHTTIANRVGFDNVTYRRGMIQDLALDLDLLETHLRENPVSGAESWLELRQLEEQLRKDRPLIEDNSVDVVLSNCVLNLVRPADKDQLFEEIFRVVKPGGRVAISDIVADEDVPVAMQNDPELWSGCISGAYREDLFLEAFSKVGFHGVTTAKRDEQPWQTVNGYEFRSMTVLAYKDLDGSDLDRNQALVYNGPFEEIQDDQGRTFRRGERTPVGERAFQRMQEAPYKGLFTAIEPRIAVPRETASEFQACRTRPRTAREMKGEDYDATGSGASSCC